MIVADTGAVVALVDADDRHHEALRKLFLERPGDWLLPWAILPEVDDLLGKRVGSAARSAFADDLSSGAYAVEWGVPADLIRAREIDNRHGALDVGLVDSVVAAVAERVGARAIATLDLRHFGVLEIGGSPRLLPRDL